MKVKNEFIKIKSGSKEYELRNMILDEYLNRFCKRQLEIEKHNNYAVNTKLVGVFLKFDTPIGDISYDSKIDVNDIFDISFVSSHTNTTQTISENSIVIQYNIQQKLNESVYDLKNMSNYSELKDYIGKKITAIGFASFFASYGTVTINTCAILDTSNYNIYVQDNQVLSIVRRDIISTDGIFNTNSKEYVPGPIHLAPDDSRNIIYEPDVLNVERRGIYF